MAITDHNLTRLDRRTGRREIRPLRTLTGKIVWTVPLICAVAALAYVIGWGLG